MNQKWQKKIYKPGKVDDRIPILQLARSAKSKKQEETGMIKKDGFKQPQG